MGARSHPNTNVLRRPFAKDEIRVWLSFALQTLMILEYAQYNAHKPIVANIFGLQNLGNFVDNTVFVT